MKSVYDAIKSVLSIDPASYTADQNGTVVDTAGYNSAKLVVAAGALDGTTGDETYVVKLQEGDLANGSDMVDITGYTLTFDKTTGDNTVQNLRIEGLGTTRKRYLRAVLDVGGTTPIALLSAVFELGRAFSEPVQS